MNRNCTENVAPPENAFEESAEEFYEAAPCGYVSTTCDGRIVKVNRTFSEWVGYQCEELTHGMRLLDLLTVGGKIFYETHFALLLRMHGHVDEIALDLRCKDGRSLPTLVTARQRCNAAGEPVVNRLTVFNATERRRYERELLDARKRAEEFAAELTRLNGELTRSNAELLKANEDLAQFAYAASHDLQEPLRTIHLYTQLLAARYPKDADEDVETFVRYILDGSLQMRMLIDDLLAFSRSQASALVLQATEMASVVEATLTNLHSLIEESGAIVTYDSLPRVTVDGPRFVQVFQNLIANGIKYRRPGAAPRVHISAVRQSPKEWLFAVEDNGAGFEPRYAEQIFGLFKRLHGKETPGTGIGLAICRKIVEAHGGRIWATSTPGVGSRFQFTIPDKSAS